MLRFCIAAINMSLFSFTVVSFLHLLNGEILSELWMSSLLALGVSSVLMVIVYFFGILMRILKLKRVKDDDTN